MRRLFDDRSSQVNFVERHGITTSYAEQNSAGTINRNVQKRIVHGFFSSQARAVFATGPANSHQCRATLAHDCFYVCKVHVDQSMLGDQLGNALHALIEHAVGHAKCIGHARILVHQLQHAVVGNHN